MPEVPESCERNTAEASVPMRRVARNAHAPSSPKLRAVGGRSQTPGLGILEELARLETLAFPRILSKSIAPSWGEGPRGRC